MTTTISRRQQARNERQLQELLQTVPGNDLCADCGARNPGWASWNFGVFLCMRCASLHRKMGTHISKVKSLSMDQWTSEQVDRIKSQGNLLTNQMLNPKNVRPPIPVDVDEVDSAMERFIRQKYQTRSLTKGPTMPLKARSLSPELQTQYSDDSPPPPPPKHGGIFSRLGHRAASSTLPARRPKIEKNKASRIFGNDIASRSPRASEDEGPQLEKLREMGFDDERTNLSILRGVGGDVDRAIEALIRLGDPHPGRRSTPRTREHSPPGDRFEWNSPAVEKRTHLAPSEAATRKFSSSPRQSSNVPQPQPKSPSLPQPQPQPPPAALVEPQPVPQLSSTNPFLQSVSPPQTAPLMNQFPSQQPAQHLFPHATGGQPRAFPQAPYQLPLTPPLPLTAQQMYYPQAPQTQILQGPLSAPPTSYQYPQNLSLQTPMQSSNPFQTMQGPPSAPLQANQHSLPMQNHNPYNQPALLTPQATGFAHNYALAAPPPAQPLVPQHTGKFDKSVIMSFYNYPHLAPQRPGIGNPQPIQAEDPADKLADLTISPKFGTAGGGSVGSNNPFAKVGGMSTSPISMASSPPMGGNVQGQRKITRDSMDVGGWQSGRHSPDAFASLSARLVR